LSGTLILFRSDRLICMNTSRWLLQTRDRIAGFHGVEGIARRRLLNLCQDEGYERRGVPEKEAERRAWATVDKDDGRVWPRQVYRPSGRP
jgi:hypothetical protein